MAEKNVSVSCTHNNGVQRKIERDIERERERDSERA